MYINLFFKIYLHLTLCAQSFFSFSPFLKILQFYFHCFIPQLAPCFRFFSSLCFNQFFSSRYNFWFPLFTRSIYYTLFLLDCFDFAYGCICICVYSVTLSIVVIILCLYIGLLQFCVFLFFLFSFFFRFASFLFFITLIFNF